MTASRTPEPQREILSVKELAAFLDVSKAWMYEHKEKFPHTRVGNRYFFSRTAIQQFVGNNANVRLNSREIEASEQADRMVKELMSINSR